MNQTLPKHPYYHIMTVTIPARFGGSPTRTTRKLKLDHHNPSIERRWLVTRRWSHTHQACWDMLRRYNCDLSIGLAMDAYTWLMRDGGAFYLYQGAYLEPEAVVR
jgi:hypothetical protein